MRLKSGALTIGYRIFEYFFIEKYAYYGYNLFIQKSKNLSIGVLIF